MELDETFSKISGYSFSLGFLLAKLKLIPIPTVSIVFNFLSHVLGFSGYVFWYIALLLRPNSAKTQEKYDEYAQIIEQHQFASAVGLIATVLGIIGIFVPVCLVLSVWLIVLANTFWVMGEYNKLSCPPPEQADFDMEKQRDHVRYTIAMSAIGFITALATTLIICFPAFTLPIFIASTIFGIGTGLLAVEYWTRVNMKKAPAALVEPTTVKADANTETKEPEAPHHGPGLFLEANQQAAAEDHETPDASIPVEEPSAVKP